MFPATSLPRFGVRRLVGALDIGVRIRNSRLRKAIQSGDKSPHSKIELLAGLEPAPDSFEASRSSVKLQEREGSRQQAVAGNKLLLFYAAAFCWLLTAY